MGDIIQSKEDLEALYKTEDPWGYRTNPEDLKRREIILSEIPVRDYATALDIGCGEGFLTCRLPAKSIVGADVSATAIQRAQRNPENAHCSFLAAGLFELPQKLAGFRNPGQFDLILITGLIYRQYFGESHVLIYDTVDRLLAPEGVLITSHIDEWYRARFPYLMLNYVLFNYREYTQRLEVYTK
jgi:2-polyprenyl-3-methyl-5-hydroxy-6-metoxy-1,4-benzoquinol methylase